MNTSNDPGQVETNQDNIPSFNLVHKGREGNQAQPIRFTWPERGVRRDRIVCQKCGKAITISLSSRQQVEPRIVQSSSMAIITAFSVMVVLFICRASNIVSGLLFDLAIPIIGGIIAVVVTIAMWDRSHQLIRSDTPGQADDMPR